MRILVVDDYPGAAEASCVLLRLLGHDCYPAMTGTAALEGLAEHDPDIVLLDIGLPDLSGYDVAREIRSRTGTERVFIAALTGWATAEDRVRALAAGIDMHLEKPPSRADLESVVHAARTRQVSAAHR